MIGEVLGNYRITDQIGSGGMGIVYAAEHILLGKLAAIKVLKPERCESPEIVERFFNEARAAAMVKDPGIPEIFDYGRLPEGNAYLVMEMLEGRTLGSLLEGRVKLSAGRALSLARLMAGTLKATHEHGIIHRDLKPDNVFIVPDHAMPRGERIQILDFGIAKLQGSEHASSVRTETGRLMGTPYYMSPEQCRGSGTINHRTDIYSLGCVLYQMLCGRPPFALKGSGEVLAAHIHLAPRPLSEVEASVPPELEAVAMRMLAKDPDDRPQTMQEVMDALNEVVSLPGVVTPEPSLAASADMEIELLRDTVDDFHPHRKTTTLEASSGEFKTDRSWTTWAPAARSPVRQILVPIALLFGVAFGGWGAWTVLEQKSADDMRPSAVTTPAAAPAAAAVATPLPEQPPIIVREVVEAPVNHVSLTIISAPDGARVYRIADGVEVGRTPVTVQARQGLGTMGFVLRKTGYKNAKVEMAVAEDGKKAIRLDKRGKGKRADVVEESPGEEKSAEERSETTAPSAPEPVE